MQMSSTCISAVGVKAPPSSPLDPGCNIATSNTKHHSPRTGQLVALKRKGFIMAGQNWQNPHLFLDRMQQKSGLIGDNDDWTGSTSYATRKKLQNRVNQRAHRMFWEKLVVLKTRSDLKHRETQAGRNQIVQLIFPQSGFYINK